MSQIPCAHQKPTWPPHQLPTWTESFAIPCSSLGFSSRFRSSHSDLASTFSKHTTSLPPHKTKFVLLNHLPFAPLEQFLLAHQNAPRFCKFGIALGCLGVHHSACLPQFSVRCSIFCGEVMSLMAPGTNHEKPQCSSVGKAGIGLSHLG